MDNLDGYSSLNDRRPKVSIHMPPYDHETYIAEAIESVFAQKTDFTFELVIRDDCSTDNTRGVARDYARRYPEHIRRLEHPHNLGS